MRDFNFYACRKKVKKFFFECQFSFSLFGFSDIHEIYSLRTYFYQIRLSGNLAS